ncbi:MAG: DNA primase [Alphaproteobacteria bacterium]
MRFAPSFLDDIRGRISVSEVVGRGVTWDRRKSVPSRQDYWACCPFHSEKTPSFHADDRRGRYHCFGCGVSGDIFTFLVEKQGLTFPEAVEQLAAQAGLEMPAYRPEDQARDRRRASLQEVVEAAARYFEEQLAAPQGQGAQRYLRDRGLDVAIQRTFRLGFAPAGRHGLKNHLAQNGVDEAQMVEAGLLIAGPDIKVSFDRFRDRLIFPINDARGRVVGFGGRALSEGAKAKYLNSPETPLFHKGRTLYNLGSARTTVRAAGTVIVVEGYMDVIALAQAGLAHTVAPLGTALTEEQIRLLWRLTPEPVLCFDGDEAGTRAAHRAADLTLEMLTPGFSLRFAFLPPGLDPDDMVRGQGVDALSDILAAARPLVDVLWSREAETAVLETPEQRAALEKTLEALVRRIGDEKVQRHYQQEIRQRLAALWAGGQDRAAGGQARQRGNKFGARAPMRVSQSVRQSTLAQAGATGAMTRREALIVFALINHPGLVEHNVEEIAELEFTSRELETLKQQIVEACVAEIALDRTALKGHLRDQGFANLLDRLEKMVGSGGDWFVRVDAGFEDAQIGWRHVLARQNKAVPLARELKEAEQALASETTPLNMERLNVARQALENFEGNEAGIDGYGTTGRGAQKARTPDGWAEQNKHRFP